MAIVKFNAINQVMTEMIKKYLGYGLELDVNAMSGTQGEKGKVALADQDNVYFIYANETNIGEDFLTSHSGIKVIVERHNRDRRDMNDNWHTYWLGQGEVVEEIIYHELLSTRRRNNKAYTTDEAEWKRIYDKHWERVKNNRIFDSWIKKNFEMDRIIEIVKVKTGRKRVSVENILGVEKSSGRNYWVIEVMFNSKKQRISIGH